MELLPIDIEQRAPTEASMEIVRNFAKLTGDIRSLSATDMAGTHLINQFSLFLQLEDINSFEVNLTNLTKLTNLQ